MELLVFGDVSTIVKGNISQEQLITLNPSDFAAGIGVVVRVYEEQLHCGEGFLIDKAIHAYIPPNDYEQTAEFQTPFFMAIKTQPEEEVETGEYASVEALYEELLQQYPNGFVVMGKVLFNQLDSISLKKTPTEGVDVTKLKDEYWETESFSRKQAQIFGVVKAEGDSKIFCQNPGEKGKSKLHSHSHVLIEEGARRLLTQSSIIESQLFVESIS